MKRETRLLIGLAAAVITYASLTAFVGPRYPAGWQYDHYYRGFHHHWYPYRPYWQQPPYAPPDSFYLHPPTPQKKLLILKQQVVCIHNATQQAAGLHSESMVILHAMDLAKVRGE